MTLTELHRFLGYRVEDEIAPKAEGPIAETFHTVQRPLAKQRQADIAEYQESTLLNPPPLIDSVKQGYQPAITLMADQPLRITKVPGVASLMGMGYASISKDPDTIIVVSDGVGRVSGLELLQRKYQKGGPHEFRQRRVELDSLRIPVLILFPVSGELTEEHMQQALFDQNVLAKPLEPAQALARDHRSPYTAIFRHMFEGDNEKRFDLAKHGVNWKTRTYGPNNRDLFVAAPMLKFVKIATEGPKFAESARGAGSTLANNEIEEIARDIAFFWSTIIAAARSYDPGQFLPGSIKENMGITGAGLTSLAVIAYELFRSPRGKALAPAIRLEAIQRIGRRDWSRKNSEWETLGIVERIEDPITKAVKYVLHGAGASSARAMTSYLLEIVGFKEREPAAVA